jgi:hypothetical protein
MQDIPDNIDTENALPERVSRAARETGLTAERIEPLIAIFQPLANQAATAIAAAGYVGEGEVEAAKEARVLLKRVRCAVESKRKEEKADSLKLGRAIDAVAGIITNVVEPVEAAMEKIEKAEEIKAQAAKIERANKRREEITAIGGIVPDALLLNEMNDQAWSDYIYGAKIAKDRRDQEVAKLAAEAAAREEARKAEEARLRAENERLAKVAQEAEQARIQAESAARKEREALAAEAIKAARAAREAQEKVEAAARAEREKLEAEAAKERQAREALETEARVRELDAKRKADAEKRTAAKAARAPDKEKLLALADTLEAIAAEPTMSTNEGREVMAQFKSELHQLLDGLRRGAELL